MSEFFSNRKNIGEFTQVTERTEENSMARIFQGVDFQEFNNVQKHDGRVKIMLSDFDFTKIVDMSSMFENASNFELHINTWNTSNVTTMASMFKNAKNFKILIETWNTSNVTTMQGMFFGANDFNQPLNFTNTSNVTTMEGMFSKARNFNQPLRWNTSNVVNMSNMFSGATSFNSLIEFNFNEIVNRRNMFDVFDDDIPVHLNDEEANNFDNMKMRADINQSSLNVCKKFKNANPEPRIEESNEQFMALPRNQNMVTPKYIEEYIIKQKELLNMISNNYSRDGIGGGSNKKRKRKSKKKPKKKIRKKKKKLTRKKRKTKKSKSKKK